MRFGTTQPETCKKHLAMEIFLESVVSWRKVDSWSRLSKQERMMSRLRVE